MQVTKLATRQLLVHIMHSLCVICYHIEVKPGVPRTFRAARSRCTIPRSSKYDIPYNRTMHMHCNTDNLPIIRSLNQKKFCYQNSKCIHVCV